jgi:hypothetical protein
LQKSLQLLSETDEKQLFKSLERDYGIENKSCLRRKYSNKKKTIIKRNTFLIEKGKQEEKKKKKSIAIVCICEWGKIEAKRKKNEKFSSSTFPK